MTERMLPFPKPKFSDLLAKYKVRPTSVHDCKLIDPTQSEINTCAARMSEALVLANKRIASRSAIGKLGTGGGDGASFLLGKYGYSRFGKLCPHGISRGAQDLAAFLAHHWGHQTLGWPAQTAAPKNVKGKKGIIAFMKIPGFSGQGHIDLWNDDKAVGHDYWEAETIWLWVI